MDMITLAMAKAYSDSKGGYTEPEKLIFEAALNYGQYREDNRRIYLEPGETYTVRLDSGCYKTVCKNFHVPTGMVAILGDGSALGLGEPTGEPFCVAEIYNFVEGGLVVADANGGANISIVKDKTIHPMDSKFIPPLDSVTLNGQDGKQYKLYVDATGALKTEVIN